MWKLLIVAALIGLPLLMLPLAPVDAACCYFSAKDKDILQPAQKVFITWDPVEKVETFTVQPKFEGNALDFGMVIPTPTQAQAATRCRATSSRNWPSTPSSRNASTRSRSCCPRADRRRSLAAAAQPHGGRPTDERSRNAPTTVKVLEAGVVGSLDYKIIERRPGRRPVPVAEGEQVQLRRR